MPRSSSTWTPYVFCVAGSTPSPPILCSCGGNVERVHERVLVLHRLADELEAADRVVVLHELVADEPEVVEPLPPRRLRLAAVVVEEVREEPARVALLRALEQRLVQRRPLGVALLGLFRPLPLLGRRPPRQLGRPQPEQPLVQLEGRAAVLLVVEADPLEQRVVPGLHPLLEEDDRLVPARHRGRALEAVELLHLLDRVARHRGAERLPDDAVEVDEDLLPEEVVDLVLADGVLAHEPPERGSLVRRVVVDVQDRDSGGGARRASRRSGRRRPSRRPGRGPRPRRSGARRPRRGSSSRRGTRARARARRTGGPRGRARRRRARGRGAAGSPRPPRPGGARGGTRRSPGGRAGDLLVAAVGRRPQPGCARPRSRARCARAPSAS